MDRFISGHVSYDRVANGGTGLIMKGNIYADNMIGFHVRAFSDTECNGFTNAPGHLQDFDLNVLQQFYPEAYRRVLAYVRAKDSHFQTQQGWVYLIRHSVRKAYGRYEPSVHGVLITTYDHKLLLRLDREAVSRSNYSRKSQLVMDAITPRLAEAA